MPTLAISQFSYLLPMIPSHCLHLHRKRFRHFVLLFMSESTEIVLT